MQIENVVYSNGYPENTAIPFNGLSKSSYPGTLLDGQGGHRQWFYSVGNNENFTRAGSLNDNRAATGNPAVNLPNAKTSTNSYVHALLLLYLAKVAETAST